MFAPKIEGKICAMVSEPHLLGSMEYRAQPVRQDFPGAG